MDKKEKLFSMPTDKRTEDYITGRFERACQVAELDADRSAGNGGKSVVFRKNIGNFRKIRGGIDMMCPVFSKK